MKKLIALLMVLVTVLSLAACNGTTDPSNGNTQDNPNVELDLQQTQDLIRRAGYALTNSSIFDLIIQYHIENKIYNVVEINIVLYEFDQMLLGA